jgi:hypothetical protein
MEKQISNIKKNEIALNESVVKKFKRRMLEWPNPVEYVNNMYGCHPEDDNMEYFQKVFENEKRKKS